MKIKLEQDYRDLRAQNYPDRDEQLGAAMKAIAALAAGKPVPDDALEILDAVEAVKTKIPSHLRAIPVIGSNQSE